MFRPAFALKPSAERPREKFYDTQWWRKNRLRHLRANPICVFADDPQASRDCLRVATIVDHVKPISAGADPKDMNNWRGLCLVCNAKVTANYRLTGRNELP